MQPNDIPKAAKICHGDVGGIWVSLLSDNPWAEPFAPSQPPGPGSAGQSSAGKSQAQIWTNEVNPIMYQLGVVDTCLSNPFYGDVGDFLKLGLTV